MAETKNLVVGQGKTFSQVVRWETSPIVYKAITGITQSAPVRITCPSHGIPSGWRAAAVSVKGMSQINAANNPPKATDYRTVTVVDTNTVEFNDVNSADYKAYVSGGYLQYNTPVDLTGFTARMQIKDKIGGTVLASTELADAPKNVLTATVNPTDKTITLAMTAADTAAFTWAKGVYELEMVSGTGEVTGVLVGAITVTKEVTV